MGDRHAGPAEPGIVEMIFIFNFKRQFAPAVRSGLKRQTVRSTRKDSKRPQLGDSVKLYTGLRTTATTLLNAGPVVRCRSVRMDIPAHELVIDGELQSIEQSVSFAQADGFAGRLAMFDWFADQYGSAFEGFCVEWNPEGAAA